MIGYDRAIMTHVLLRHQRHVVQGTNQYCLCGWGELGDSHPTHILDEYEKLAPTMDPDRRHLILFTEDGWTIQHPVHERLAGSLFGCKFKWEGGDIGLRGKYELVTNDSGELLVGEEVQ